MVAIPYGAMELRPASEVAASVKNEHIAHNSFNFWILNDGYWNILIIVFFRKSSIGWCQSVQWMFEFIHFSENLSLNLFGCGSTSFVIRGERKKTITNKNQISKRNSIKRWFSLWHSGLIHLRPFVLASGFNFVNCFFVPLRFQSDLFYIKVCNICCVHKKWKLPLFNTVYTINLACPRHNEKKAKRYAWWLWLANLRASNWDDKEKSAWN